MNTPTVPNPSLVPIKPDVYDTLSTVARETGTSIGDLVGELIKESLTRREIEREKIRRDLLLDELTQETERLNLYGTPPAVAL